MTRPNSSAFARIAVLSVILTVAPVASAVAQAGDTATANPRLQTTSSTRTPDARINLLSQPRAGQPVVRVRQMGSGSWICSPAGFGQRSRCYRN